jgi:hypothetical protein
MHPLFINLAALLVNIRLPKPARPGQLPEDALPILTLNTRPGTWDYIYLRSDAAALWEATFTIVAPAAPEYARAVVDALSNGGFKVRKTPISRAELAKNLTIYTRPCTLIEDSPIGSSQSLKTRFPLSKHLQVHPFAEYVLDGKASLEVIPQPGSRSFQKCIQEALAPSPAQAV